MMTYDEQRAEWARQQKIGQRRTALQVALMILAIVFACGSATYLGYITGGEHAHIACDNAVQRLMTTDNLVELKRSIFIIRYLDCRLSSRL